MKESPAQKLVRLVGEGVSVRSAAKAAHIPHSTAVRITASVPFGAEIGGPRANLPTPAWTADQPVPAPTDLEFRTGYHDQTLRAWSAPIAFESWTIERIRAAIALHDQGFFVESSLLAITATRFGPVFAALSQAIAPALALPRKVNGGTRGLSRVLREAVEDQISPRDGLAPTPYFPPTIWGAAAILYRMMGFVVLQHVYGDPDPETGVRMLYTRIWPHWALTYYRQRRTFVAITSDGPVDIVSGDGKWTLIADTEEPHFDGAIRALGIEVLDGTMAKAARASYLDKYGNPKWVGTMPEGVGVRTDEGRAFMQALGTLRGPDGFGALPHGSTLTVEGLQGQTSTVFKDALDNVWQFCAAILLGSDGTMTRGTGVYSAPIFAGVRRDLVDRMLKSMVRGVNLGHIRPWLMFNFSASIEEASGWVMPVLDIPLPDPDADARIKSYSDRVKTFHEIIASERAGGFVITQERVDQLATALSIDPPALGGLALSDDDRAKALTIGEVRKATGLEPLGDDRDGMLVPSVDSPGATTVAVEQAADGVPVTGPVKEPASEASAPPA